jgi:hypothetical protein
MPRGKKAAAAPVIEEVVEEEKKVVEEDPIDIRDEDIEDAETIDSDGDAEDDALDEEECGTEAEYFEVLYNLMTDKDGNNAVDVLGGLKESIDKQNKIMFKIMNLLQDHFVSKK